MKSSQNADKSYSLKGIVMARALAELTALIILVVLPFLLLSLGRFFALHLVFRAGICILSPLALLCLWGMARLAYKVILQEDGVTVCSVLKKQFLPFEEMLVLRQSSKLGLRRYLLRHSSGHLSFPCLINHAAELAAAIRDRLPERGRSVRGEKQLYYATAFVLALEFLKLLLQGAFAFIFFWFYESLQAGGKTSPEDSLFVLAVAVALAGLLLFRLAQFFRLPRAVVLDGDGLQMRKLLGSSQVRWSEISNVSQTGLLYPEGIFVAAGKKRYLIAELLEAYDELAEEIRLRAGKAGA